MSIKYVMLGFLSETPLTGYDLKKKFSASEIFHWSGNNNQIYRSLVELHSEKLVTIEIQHQDSKPPRKIYTITEAGRAALREWMRSTPELPQFRSGLLMHLTWADQLEIDELRTMLASYEEELTVHVLMLHEQGRRNIVHEQRGHVAGFKDRITEHWLSFYENELTWVRALRKGLRTD